ncbi:polymorphic toxin type 44 domain-containing protein [Lactovum odontotermitis]
MGRILDTGDIAAATGGESAITDTIGAFNSVKSEMTDFVDNQALKGQGWDSARNVINNVFQVLTNAYTMWGELILEANAKLGAAASKLKNDFIDEDALKHQIAMIKSNIVTVQYEMQAAQMYPASTAADAAAAASMVSACQFRIRELEKQQKKIQEELDSLDEFDSATSGLYAEAMALQSQINGLLTNVTNKGTWSTPTGLFTTEHLNMKLVHQLAGTTVAYQYTKTGKLPKLYQQEIDEIKKGDFSAVKKADKIAAVYESFLHSLAPDAFDDYDKIRAKFKTGSPEREKAEIKLTEVLQGLPLNIKLIVRKMAEDDLSVSDKGFDYSQFINMVNTRHPLDLKNRQLSESKSGYSIWSRGWNGNPLNDNKLSQPSPDYLGNFLFGYYGQGDLAINGETLKMGAGAAQMYSDAKQGNFQKPISFAGKILAGNVLLGPLGGIIASGGSWALSGYGDNPGDGKDIQDGIDDYNKTH